MRLTGRIKTREVWLNGELLTPFKSQEVWNHSPDGFNWGYGGSGAAQLALAICLEYLTNEAAVKEHQRFKWEHIATLPQSDFDVTITDQIEQ